MRFPYGGDEVNEGRRGQRPRGLDALLWRVSQLLGSGMDEVGLTQVLRRSVGAWRIDRTGAESAGRARERTAVMMVGMRMVSLDIVVDDGRVGCRHLRSTSEWSRVRLKFDSIG